MKKSVKKEIHTGEQPIRVLKHNLTTRLVERNEDYIKSLQSDFKLHSYIKYHIADLPLVEKQTPFIDSKGMINLHETYLSYVWIVCYYFHVIHEEMLVIPEWNKRNPSTPKQQNLEIVENAENLFDYGKSLIMGFYPWDKIELPNPEFLDEDTDQGMYILKTNDLFVEVMNFILYHETAHAEYEHIRKKHNISDKEQKNLEIDADTRAIELILSHGKSKKTSELGITIGLASMLFFSKNLEGGKKHPNIDVRLDNALKILKSKNDSPIWSMLVLFLKVWDKQFNIGLTNKPHYETYKDLFHEYFLQIKQ